MKELLEKDNLLRPLQVGKIVEGRLTNKANSAVYLDLGAWGTGIIYGREFLAAKEELKRLKVGDKVFAKITDLENEQGYVELSLSQASSEIVWDGLREKKEKGEKVTVQIESANKGGLLARVSGIPAFLPVSQLSTENYPRVEGAESMKILSELQKFVGKEMEVTIFDLDPRDKKLILSEKAKEIEKIKELLKNYKIGDVVEGKITGVTDFGVFMKFDGEELEGLIHISELDWQLIENPSDLVKVGDKVKAKIISITNDKVSLSLKALKEDPWQDIEKKYKKDDIIEGQVSKFNPYGAFIKITPKIQGLCHVSEFGTKTQMEAALKLGNKYKFEILSVEPQEHRMSLKLAEEKK